MGTKPPFVDLPVDNPAVPEVFADGFMIATGPEVVRIAFHASQPSFDGQPARPRITQKLAITPATFRNLLAVAAASVSDMDRPNKGAIQ